MKRYMYVIFLAVMLMLSLAGCKKNNEDSADGKVGELYYEEVSEENVAVSDNGVDKYINNQIVVVANENAEKKEIENLAEKYNAKVVGCIEIVGYYQWKLNSEMREQELNALIDTIISEDKIDEAYLNYANYSGEEAVYNPNDTEWANEWNDNNWKDGNWGAKAILAQYAWVLKDKMQPINIGLIDGEFQNHSDLGFGEIINNPDEVKDFHGNHVAGIMGARFDNKTGIAGIYPKADGHLYGLSIRGGNVSSTFSYLEWFAELIVRNVKVINYSMGYDAKDYDDMAVRKFLAARGDEIARESTNKDSDYLAKYLIKFLDKGYDFVIVASAGNDANMKFVCNDKKNTTYPYGWEKSALFGETNDNMARWNSIVTAISDEELEKRIIVVGAAKMCEDGTYEKTDFSNGGDRVDIIAPGYGIESTVLDNGYDRKDGTSMAAPHVSGIAAMVWSLNTELKGDEVKKIICDSANEYGAKVKNSDKNMANALYAIGKSPFNLYVEDKNKKDYGGIISYICNAKEELLSDAKIEIINKNTGKTVENSMSDSNGYIQIVIPEGEYSIKVSHDGYSPKTVDNVKVEKNKFNYIEAIKLSEGIKNFSIPEEKVVTVGEIDVIEADTDPENATDYVIKWSSSDESVATVSPTGEAGIITAKSKGSTVITAELTLGDKTITKTTNLRVASKGRDTILVLDVSGSMYGTPIEEMKKSAVKFCNDLLSDEYNNRVGIVFYDDDIYKIDLTDDLNSLIKAIESVDYGGMTNMEEGLATAEKMMDDYGRENCIKNIIVMADGLPNDGATSSSGSSGTMESEFAYYYDSVLYANAVIDKANDIMGKYNLYSLGFFHSLFDLEKDFASELMSRLTNKQNGYYQVDRAEDLQFVFGDITEDISSESKIVINIACPVDVVVSYKGEMLSSNPDSYSDNASFGTLQLLGKKKDIKVLSLDRGNDYEIELSGTDTGSMDYSVNYFDENGNIEDYREFSNVPLTSRTRIKSSTENSKDVSLNVDLDGDGEVDQIWTAGIKSSAVVTYEREQTVETQESTEEADNNGPGMEVWQIILIISIILIIIIIIIICIAVASAGNKEKTYNQKDEIIPVVPIRQEVNHRDEEKSPDKNKSDKFETDKRASDSAGKLNSEYELSEAGIKILSGSLKGSVIPMADGQILYLGKDPKVANVVFTRDYGLVSRMHCSISYSSVNRKYFVTDCSRNGTYYDNKVRFVKEKRTAVRPDTIIMLANEECRLYLK